MAANDPSIERHLNAGLAKHQSGEIDGAIVAYRRVLDMVPEHPEALHLLGLAFHRQGNSDQALSALEQAVQCAPDVPDFKFNLAVVQTDTKNFEAAKRTYEELIAAGYKNETVLNGYALSLKSLGMFSDAEDVLRELVETHPRFIGGIYNLANLLLSRGKANEALPLFEKALNAQPNNIDVVRNMATAQQMLGKVTEGIKLLTDTLQRHSNDSGALNNLGNLYRQSGDLERAKSVLEKAIEMDPTLPDAPYNLGATLADQNDTTAAIRQFQIASQHRPEFVKARWASKMALPQIYQSTQHRDDCRAKWLSGVQAITAEVEAEATNDTFLSGAFDAISEITPFALSYQGGNDRSAMKAWGSAVGTITAHHFPDIQRPDPDLKRDKPLIVFASAHLRDHTITRLFKNWIKYLDRTDFDIQILSTSGPGDAVTRGVSSSVDVAHTHNMTVTECAYHLSSLDADALVFTDIGMDPKTQILASLPLARNQLMAWGHPVTSGFETIDMFLSSDLMEPANGDQHYTEELLRLPGLSICYDKPADAGVKRQSHDFLCAQSLFKISPDQDEAFARILADCPQSTLAFFAHPIPEVTQAFRTRISGICISQGIEADTRLHFIPPCDRQSFLGHLAGSKVILDTFEWSGGNTSLESFAMGRPVVTLPGEFMRGRHTYAMLQLMGMPALIATDPNDYCRIAIDLFANSHFNDQLANNIREDADALFDDHASVEALNQILRDL